MNIEKLLPYNFMFKDFSLYNTTLKTTNVQLKAKLGEVYKDKFICKDITLNIKYDNKHNANIKSKNIEYKDNIVYLKDKVIFTNKDIQIYSDNIKYNVKKKNLSSNNAIIKSGINTLKSSKINFDLKTQSLDAKNIQVVFNLDNAKDIIKNNTLLGDK
jgi:lipopolysaccharide assembly outer membrane protein LptD (OstA)